MAQFSNLRSKLDRAVAAYLQSQGAAQTILTAFNSGVISFGNPPSPIVIVRSHSGQALFTDDLPNAWKFQVHISVRAPAITDASVIAGQNPETARVQLDEVFGDVVDALLTGTDLEPYNLPQSLDAVAAGISAQGRALASIPANVNAFAAQNNADMTAFTCQRWYFVGLDGGMPREESSSETTTWAEIVNFAAIVASANTD